MGDHKSVKEVRFDKVHKMSEKQPLLDGGVDTPPKDTLLLCYFIMFFHGVGHLLPWNFFITAYGYFEMKFECPGNSSAASCNPHLQKNFENYFSVASMVPVAVMTAVNIYLQSIIHYKHRMIISLSFTLFFFVLTTVLVPINTSHWVNGFFVLTIFIVTFMSVFSALFQSSTFGLAGVLPPKYMSIVMTGQALAGIIAAVANIISLAAGKTLEGSALGYFFCAVFVIFICTFTFFILMRLKFVQYYMAKTSFRTSQAKKSTVNGVVPGAKVADVRPPFLKVFFSIAPVALSVLLVFTVTLSLFPSVLVLIHSTAPFPLASVWTDRYFTPLVCFVMFNCSDLAGRYITHWVMVFSNRWILLSLTILRIGFIPLILFCNVSPDSRHAPVLFQSDVFPVVFILVFGFSNGYLSSLAMITAPQSVKPDWKETASTIMSFFLTSGLMLGSLFSFLFANIVSFNY